MALRVAWLTNAPSGDQLDVLTALAAHPDIDLVPIYCSRALVKGTADFRAPQGKGVPLRGFTLPGGLLLNPPIISHLIRSQYDIVVVGGYSHFTMQLAMLVRWMQGKPWVLFAERPGMNPRKFWVTALRSLSLSSVRAADGIIATGKLAQRLFESEFDNRIAVYSVPYVIDPQPFLNIERPSKDYATEISFMACGQLIHRKGLDVLLDAFQSAAIDYANIFLTIVGDGPERSALMALVKDEFRRRVTFVGQVPFDERVHSFAEADVFVHPARHDGWGVVIQEAMAAGLPTIATRETGAALDLIDEGKNGFLFDADDSAALTEKIIWFAEHQDQILAFGDRARNAVRTLTPAWAAQEIATILGSVCDKGLPIDYEGPACDPIDCRS